MKLHTLGRQIHAAFGTSLPILGRRTLPSTSPLILGPQIWPCTSLRTLGRRDVSDQIQSRSSKASVYELTS